jgi:hypothetical protein
MRPKRQQTAAERRIIRGQELGQELGLEAVQAEEEQVVTVPMRPIQ